MSRKQSPRIAAIDQRLASGERCGESSSVSLEVSRRAFTRTRLWSPWFRCSLCLRRFTTVETGTRVVFRIEKDEPNERFLLIDLTYQLG